MTFDIANSVVNGDCKCCYLTTIVPFEERGIMYFHLRYHVVKTDGEEGEIFIPKVNNPFASVFPMMERELSLEQRFSNSDKLVVRDRVDVESTQYDGHTCLYYYVKTKDAPVKEMTHEEIEEKLGHPFKEVKKKSTKK